MKKAIANRLAVYLIARSVENHRPDWEDVPELPEAEWAAVSTEISVWVARLYEVAGSAGLDAYREAS